MDTVSLSEIQQRSLEELREMGYKVDAPPSANSFLPPGNAHWAVPHFQGFNAIYNAATRIYRYTFDEALRNSQCNTLAMLRDPVIKEALKARIIPTAQLAWHMEPDDEMSPDEAEAAIETERILRRYRKFQQMRWWLLWAIWYGRSAVQVKWDYDFRVRKGQRTLIPAAHTPINGDKLIFKYDGRLGVLTNAMFEGVTEPSERGPYHLYTPEERMCIVVHKFEPVDADYYEPDLAGAINGRGLRDELYYLWIMKNTYFSMLLDYMQRTALGFTVYYYQAGNKESLIECREAAEKQMGNAAILFPRLNEPGDRGPGVQRVEPGQGGATIFNAMKDYFDGLIRRTILMQTMTTITGASELGGDSAGALEASSGRLQKYDAACLEESLNEDLIPVLYHYNYPGMTPGRLTHSVDKPDAASYMQAAQVFYNLGGTLDEDDLRSVLGLPKPEKGHSVLSLASQAQPSMDGMTPEGIPQIGDQGPEDQAVVQGVE